MKRAKSLKTSFYITGCAALAISAMLLVYFVLIGTGVVRAREGGLIFRSGSAEKLYDGEPLTCDTWNLIDGRLKDGHTASAVVTGTQTEIGEGKNTFTVKIVDEFGLDVTNEYHIECQPGILQVNPMTLSIRTGSAEKEYDGMPLTSDAWEIIGGHLYDGHVIDVDVHGTITEIGTVDNMCSVYITDRDGNNVMEFYRLDNEYGKLKINPLGLTFQSGSAQKYYDGEPLTSDSVTLTSGALMNGHTFVGHCTGSQTEIGRSQNFFTVEVINDYGEDVSSMYKISLVYGTLRVSEKNEQPDETRTETVTETESGDASSSESQSGGGPGGSDPETGTWPDPETESETPEVTGSQTEPGEETMPQEPDMPISKDPFSPMNIPLIRVTASKGGTVYLRWTSQGDYTGVSWTTPDAFDASAYGINPAYLPALALLDKGFTVQNMSLEWLAGDYYHMPALNVPYYPTNGLDASLSDVYVPGGSDRYDISYIPYDYLTVGQSFNVGMAYAELEAAYRQYVKANYTSVPASTAAVMAEIIAAVGLDPSSPTLIHDIAGFVSSYVGYDAKTTIPDSVNDIAVWFFTDAESAYCQHYATAATVLYRMMGIPARYVTGLMTTVKGNTPTVVTDKSAHAWVEVYLDGMGWVQVEVTGGESQSLTLTPTDASYKYTGDILGPESVKLIGELKPGHRLESYAFTEDSMQRMPGTYETNIQPGSVVIVDENGHDVTRQYNITLEPGRMMIFEGIQLVIRPVSYIGMFTGRVIGPEAVEFMYGTGLADGHQLVSYDFTEGSYRVEPNDAPTAAGVSYATATQVREGSVLIVDQYGNDVTSDYSIVYEVNEKGMDIRRYTITISAADLTAHKIYDGTPLTKTVDGDAIFELMGSDDPLDGYGQYPGESAPGVGARHRLVVTTNGYIVEPGVCVNQATVTVYDENGEDVTYGYDINVKSGKLTVAYGTIALQTGSDTKVYDAQAFGNSQWSFVINELRTDHNIVVSMDTRVTNAGSVKNVPTVVITDSEGQDITHLYVLNESYYGTLKVEKRNIVLIAASGERPYDGTPYIDGSYTVNGELVNGQELYVVLQGGGTEPGRYDNVFKKSETVITDTATGESVTKNYSITYVNGVLQIIAPDIDTQEILD